MPGMDIKIGTIPDADYYTYRLDVMFDGYKWDLQEGEQGTISDKVVLLGQDEMIFLADCAVALYHETIAMELKLKHRPDLLLQMGISEEMTQALCNCEYDPERHIRMMRFDFHPTTGGWQISEVNSDVPAGYPEASIMPQLAEPYFAGYAQYGNLGEVLVEKLIRLAPARSTIAYLHDTHTVEDYQILRFLSDLLERHGHRSVFTDPRHLKWKDNKAQNVGAIMRYFPVEWLEFHEGVDWRSIVNAQTPSCNHPLALLTQSKRLPVVWDQLGVNLSFWKRLLPETKCYTSLAQTDGWILKPAFGRVGEGINIPATVSDAENKEIQQAASECPLQWVAQRMFQSVPIDGLHLNLGVFVIDGQFAGLYGRAGKSARIDAKASELPVLVKKERM